jgi:transcriptional regulator with GAF, ATPase, and Fis domain
MAELADETSTGAGWLDEPGQASHPGVLGLCLAWSLAEPGRVGEVALMPGPRAVLGRGAGSPEDDGPRLRFGRWRPGGVEEGEALAGQGVSRLQLRLRTRSGGLEVENVGRAPLRLNGAVTPRAAVGAGDVLQVDRQLVMLVVARPRGLLSRGGPPPTFAFGEPDASGIVGEAPATWVLRDEVALAARRTGHALVVGQSGTGKELIARALHACGARSVGPFVARNAATLPAGVLDAELFGNAKNYPNAGMAERPGLVGEAHGGTLFLDEIGELSPEFQAHLLRLLDSGEYHRLGEAAARRVDLRVIAATNRGEAALKSDFGARFPLRIRAPGLDERAEDVPLLVRHLLRAAARREPLLLERFAASSGAELRVDPALIEALLRHGWTTHVRELELLLSTAIAGSHGAFIALTEAVKERLSLRGREPSAEEISSALERTRGNISRAAQELGLPSRDVLYRLLKKHSIKPDRGEG